MSDQKNKFGKYSPILQTKKPNKRETSNSSINSKKRALPSNASGVSQKEFSGVNSNQMPNRRGSSLSNTHMHRKQSDPLHAAAFKFSANTSNALAGGANRPEHALNKTMDVRPR